MRRVGFVLGALILVVGALVPALAQQPFADVPLDHWAYAAVNKLAETGLMEGYPDGTYKGKQPLTRYEFAQALARMLDRVEAMAKEPGPPGPPGPAGPAGPGGGAGLTAEQQALLDKLAKEFAPELKALRSDLDSLTKRVEDLEAKEAPKGPVVTVGGSINVRAGLYGTELGVKDTESTGYPYLFWSMVPDGGGGGGVAADGYGFWPAPWGSINIPFWDAELSLWSDDPDYPNGPAYAVGIPISDALKDAYKAADFMTQRTKVSFSGQLDDKTSANVTVLADARTNDTLRFGDFISVEEETSPNALAGNGVMDTVKVDEAWVKHRTSLLVPVDITVGKQYFRRGVGLLADNSQEAIKALGLAWTASDALSFGTVLGMLDREEFYGLTASPVGWPKIEGLVGMYLDNDGQDNYDLFYLDWKLSKSWALGVNWLESGIADEQGYSVSLMGKLYGLDVFGEYAKLQQWPSGNDFIDWNDNDVREAGELELSESDKAWVAGLKWDGDWVQLLAEYGQIDAGYAFALDGAGWNPILWGPSGFGSYNLPLSALHPLAEVNPHFINWVDRPLFLDPTNIARGWHVGLTFPKLLGESTPVSVSYASGDAYSGRYLSWLVEGGPESGIVEPDKWVDADAVWTVQVSRQLSQNVTARLLYGRREVDNVMSAQKLPYTRAVVDDELVSYYATNDPIQVIRAELCVAF